MIAIINYNAGISRAWRGLCKISGKDFVITGWYKKAWGGLACYFPESARGWQWLICVKKPRMLQKTGYQPEALMGICWVRRLFWILREMTLIVSLIAGSQNDSPKINFRRSGIKDSAHGAGTALLFSRNHSVFQDIPDGCWILFCALLYPAPSDESTVLGITDYGINFLLGSCQR